jgi:hypothetical protein
MQEMTVMDMSATSRKIGQLLVADTSKKRRRMDPLLISQEAVRGGQG